MCDFFNFTESDCEEELTETCERQDFKVPSVSINPKGVAEIQAFLNEDKLLNAKKRKTSSLKERDPKKRAPKLVFDVDSTEPIEHINLTQDHRFIMNSSQVIFYYNNNNDFNINNFRCSMDMK